MVLLLNGFKFYGSFPGFYGNFLRIFMILF